VKAIVIYDSLYGNTEKIAVAVAEGLTSAVCAADSIEMVKVGEAHPDQLAEWGLLLVGAPTHGSHPSPAASEFINRIPQGALAGVKVGAFDTRTDMEKLTGMLRLFGKVLGAWGYAAPRLSAALEAKGGDVICPPEGFFVKDKEGPLEEGELERATAWAQRIGQAPGVTQQAAARTHAAPDSR
jgi:flavodoxin